MSALSEKSKIYVAGHRGMVGSSLLRMLNKSGYKNLLIRTSKELDLTRQADVESFFDQERPDFVILAAAKVGGILANQNDPTGFLYKNLMISTNVIEASAKFNVKKLLYLGSSCVFPKFAEQPIKESSLLTGSLEKTNEAYAVAKIAGLKFTEYYNRQFKKQFISAMPSNLYGYEDNFHPSDSHVIPGLIQRMHEAKTQNLAEFKAWGTGLPLREFLFVDDLAAACLFLLKNYSDPEIINVGSGEEVSIKALVEMIAKVVGYQGKITFDSSKPDGTPRKIMDSSKINRMGWAATIRLEEGLRLTYDWFLKQKTHV